MANADRTVHEAPLSSDEFSAIVVQHGRFVWRVLRHQGVPDRQVEDLSQEVFIVVFRNFGAFEHRSSLRTWIYGICRNVAADARRRVRRKPEVLTDTPPETPSPEAQTEALLREDARGQLRRVLAKLSESTRLVFVLYELENMPMIDVAQCTGCNLSTAYSRLYAARRRVRGALLAVGFADCDLEFAGAG
jgi:RNA polymerase sigma-70 factor (ECF subfamily)